MKGNNDAFVVNAQLETAVNAKVIKDFNSFVPLYTSSGREQSLLSELNLFEKPTELHYVQGSVFAKILLT